LLPARPAGLRVRVRVLSATTIELTWQPVGEATQYRIEWDAGAGKDKRLFRAQVVETRYVEGHLIPGDYCFWVSAVGPGGTSTPAAISVRVSMDLVTTPAANRR
jgi:hypothetical protein